MRTDEARKWLDSGISLSDLQYVLYHSEIGEEYQNELLKALRDGGVEAFNSDIEWLIDKEIWDEEADERLQTYSQQLEDRMLSVVDEVEEYCETSQTPSIGKQYLTTAYILRQLFYDKENGDIRNLPAGDIKRINFTDSTGVEWKIGFFLKDDSVWEELEPFDLAVLDAVYTLYCADIKIFSLEMLDKVVSGNEGRGKSKQKIKRLMDSVVKLNNIKLAFAVREKKYEKTPLLDVELFFLRDKSLGYLYGINNLYQYAAEYKEIASVPKEYFDTSKLLEPYKFQDTQTAILIKRRVIAKVMGIIRMSEKKGKRFANWNRISLIQKKDRRKGIFPELDLMPDINGLGKEDAEKEYQRWRKKEKPLYVKIVKGTLENLKANYAILDYTDYRENPKDPVSGFDIECFTVTERNALDKMRGELKSAYVQNLLEKHRATKNAAQKK